MSVHETSSSDFIRIVEVGPRDGLQNEKTMLSVEDKAQYIRLLKLAGVQELEVTSFVRPDKIPQLKDARELLTLLNKGDAAIQPFQSQYVLIPNLKGLAEAKALDCRHFALFTSNSETFNQKNINTSIDESLVKMQAVMDEIKKDQLPDTKVRAYISMAFGCPYEGATPLKRLVQIAKQCYAMGAFEISLGDTIGIASPKAVKEVIKALASECPLESIAMHFHDTRGMALTNIYASLESGIKTFDASSGGLGGCPYALNATGNVATEDVVYLLHQQGLQTGIDLLKLKAASTFILNRLGKQSPSKLFSLL